MNITCAICTEFFVPSDDIHFTPCGHFFHFVCISHWLERSKTCPQCRNKVTGKTMRRAYFNFSNIESNAEDSTLLHSKIDSLNLKVLLKDKDLKTCSEDNTNLKKQASGLRAEVKKLELEIDKQKSAIFAFKEQTKFLKEKSANLDAAKKEIVRLTKNLHEYRNIQTLISDSQDEVDKMLHKTQDNIALITYVSVMKREMDANVQRRRELRERIKSLERDLMKAKVDNDYLLQQEAKCRQLEEDLNHSENEKRSLRSKLHELESQLSSKAKISSEDIHRFIAESPAPERLQSLRKNVVIPATPDSDVIPETPSPKRIATLGDLLDSTPESKSTSSEPKAKTVREETSPHLPVKSQGAWGYSSLRLQSAKTRPSSSSLSILNKKPRLELLSKKGGGSTEMHYDGYGGHSKNDNYPSPIIPFKSKILKNNLMSVKIKRRKTKDAESSNKKLDNFLIDLT